MMTASALDRILPLGAVFPASLVLVLLSLAAGFWLGSHRRRRAENQPEGPIGSVVGAMLGLLAFMLAFTFGMAASRFDARKQLLLDDVNAIQTAVRRSDLLPEPHRSESRALLDRYVELRVGIARDPSKIPAAMVEAESLQSRLWSRAVALGGTEMDSDFGALYVEALGDLVTVHTTRAVVALQYRIPQGVWTVLILLTVMCMGAVGFQFGIAGRGSVLINVSMAVAFSAVVTLIAQLDRPTEGALRVSQQPMLELERRLNRPGP